LLITGFVLLEVLGFGFME